ncbi:hypothetical protein HPP92_002396 [Vanilla planifolia]|uniref:Uncharacterized protein n=1 Tax=Vanilla planifolia TaxID=51239 RepID=A0A835S1I3_VANPL|nr:hypothetical protein HPP92_002762 [Vanilla planifolia]KAG0502324.1 hypothetical protein HPP92_002396 [Vanilla planifolia]
MRFVASFCRGTWQSNEIELSALGMVPNAKGDWIDDEWMELANEALIVVFGGIEVRISYVQQEDGLGE